MKTSTLCIIFYFTVLFTIAQSIPTNKETGEYEYSSVIAVPSVSFDKLYYEARKWILTTLTSDDNMVQLSDLDKKMIIASGYINLDPRPDMANCSVNFKVVLEFKDGKCKYTITNFWHRYYQSGMAEIRSPLKLIRTNNWDGVPVKQAIQDKIRDEVNTKITTMLAGLELAFKKSGNKDNEW